MSDENIPENSLETKSIDEDLNTTTKKNSIQPCGIRGRASSKAKKIKLFRNGDRFYGGLTYAVSTDRYKTFDSLLAALTCSPVCDKNVLPKGVRYLFSLDGSGKVECLEDLIDGKVYVCSSTNSYDNKTQYQTAEMPVWNTSNVCSSESFYNSSLPCSPVVTRKSHLVQFHYRNLSRDPSIIESLDENDKEFVRPKLITVFRNGPKPRRAAKVLLNKKTAHSMEQVMEEINRSIKLDTGALKKVFAMSGKQITCLQEFFDDDTIYFAFGNEKPSTDNFVLTPTETQFVSTTGRLVRQQQQGSLKLPQISKRNWMSPSDTTAPSSRSRDHSFESIQQHQKNDHDSSPIKNPAVNRQNVMGNGKGTIAGSGLAEQRDGQPTSLRVKYKVGRVIGEGKFAIVRECIEKARKLPFALKTINKTKVKEDYEALKNEVEILRKVKHENIIELIEEFETPTHHHLVFELVNNGDLFELISQMSSYHEAEASCTIRDISRGVAYLHSINIVHRDIKPENILVHKTNNDQRILKLADMGLATYATEPLFTVCGTPTYVAPEVIAELGYGLKVDVWSIGILAYILLCGFPPFSSDIDDQDELFDKILEGKFEFVSPYWDEVSMQAKELIENMLCLDVSKRPSSEDLVNNPWIAGCSTTKQKLNQPINSKNVETTRHGKTNECLSNNCAMTNTALDKSLRYFEGRRQTSCESPKPDETPDQ